MKKLYIIMVACGLLLITGGCKKQENAKDSLTKGLSTSGGKTLEMIVVASDEVYNGALRDSIGYNFEIPQQGLNQKEPLFDVVHLKPEGFIHSDMLQKHRNILIIDFKKGNPNKMYSEINQRVYPQAVYKLMVDNRDSMFSILSRFYFTIKHQFYANEHDRVYTVFKKDENVKLDKQIKDNFGINLTISADFYLAKKTDDFFWIRKETDHESYDIMIYKMPFTGNGLYGQEKIIDIRDQISQKNIPGPANGSYMGTEKRFDIVSDTIKVNGILMVETRGLWRLFGDFMGGPFVNYAFCNPATDDFVMIDCFLYSPKKSKRDLLIQLESIVYSINR
ncbi:MAG: DUF4837 family protein [Bacteroidales bacterium]|nr:DUF4837 family protein [Bacteroidales bacterium]